MDLLIVAILIKTYNSFHSDQCNGEKNCIDLSDENCSTCPEERPYMCECNKNGRCPNGTPPCYNETGEFGLAKIKCQKNVLPSRVETWLLGVRVSVSVSVC